MAKGLRKPISRSTQVRADKKFGRLFAGLSGPKQVKPQDHNRYVMIMTDIIQGSVDCPHGYDGYDPYYILEFHTLVRDSCLRSRETVWPDVSCMIRHELSLVVLLHMRPSQARRLDNIRESPVSPF